MVLFSEHLEKMGFQINPYDPCIANKTIHGKQCTIAWYVDDAKISHFNKQVVTDVIEQIEERFQQMTVTRGKKHTFLGMDITYAEKGTTEITKKVLNELYRLTSCKNFLKESLGTRPRCPPK